jgi:hypothetical protein
MPAMPADTLAILLLVGSCVLTFLLARTLGKGWRARRKEREQQARRAGESRQVRRARERGGRK